MMLREFKPLKETMIRPIFRQICDALSYLHRHQIVHRDIKLENIMLSEEGTGFLAKLADFGLAEKIYAGESRSRSRSGTAAYMAPEILMGKPYGVASDIWSLGCLLYILLTATLLNRAPVEDNSTTPINLEQITASSDCKDLLR